MSSSASTSRRLLVGVAVIALGACAGSRTAGVTSTIEPASMVPTTATTVAPTTTSTRPAPSTSTTSTAAPTTTSSTLPALGGGTTRYRVPIGDGVQFSYGRTHHDYPASDIFAGCGAPVVSPVDGTVLEVRGEDRWVASEDNPATRGGRSVTILGNDGVRYYLAHLDLVEPGLRPGTRVAIKAALGTQGNTGRSSMCHTHFAISPPCPGTEWAVRRGVIWPWGYLDAWRKGEQASPVDEVRRWVEEHPLSCLAAMADPQASDA